MKTPTTAVLLLFAVSLAGCTIADAKTAKRVNPVKAAETRRAPLGVKLLSEYQRMVLFQDRLRGLCEVVKAERVSAGKWRASCADGGAFVIKVYPDGFMTVTRS